MRFDHAPRIIVKADHSIMRAAAMLGLADCVADRIRLSIPQPTEWQCIGNQIDDALVLARADFRNQKRFWRDSVRSGVPGADVVADFIVHRMRLWP